MTSLKSNRPLMSYAPCRRSWRKSTPCWPIPATTRHQRRQMPGARDSAIYQQPARPAPPESQRTLRRAGAPARPRRCRDRDEASSGDPRRLGTLRQTEKHRRTGLRHHQGRHGIPPVPAPKGGVRLRRVGSGLHGLESEAVTCPEGITTTGATSLAGKD